jgi:hypothetical protein
MRTACRSWRAATARVLASLQPARPAPPARLAAAFPSLTTLDLSRWCQGGAGAPLEARALVGMARLVQLRELRLGSGERLGASSLRSRGAAAFPGAGAAFLGDGPDGEGEGEGPGDADGPAQPDAPVGFPGVGEAALCALPLLQLSALDLSGCVHAGDAALMGLSRLRALRSLRMRRCGGLTDAGLVAVALLPALTRLDVSECPLVSDVGLADGTCWDRLLRRGWLLAADNVRRSRACVLSTWCTVGARATPLDRQPLNPARSPTLG